MFVGNATPDHERARGEHGHKSTETRDPPRRTSTGGEQVSRGFDLTAIDPTDHKQPDNVSENN